MIADVVYEPIAIPINDYSFIKLIYEPGSRSLGAVNSTGAATGGKGRTGATSVGNRHRYTSLSNGSSLTFHARPSRRYIFCCSTRLSGRAPTRPNTAIWLPDSSTAR